jgi:peptide deformylase
MKREILLYPNPELTKPSGRITFDPLDGKGGEWVQDLQGLADDLVETMNAHGGAGLSAVQVGVPVRLFVVRGEGEEKPLVCINPTWRPVVATEHSKAWVKEGCLSFPAFFENVERFTTIEATFTDVAGIEYVQTFTGLRAQVIQHETEHLDGKLLSDNLGFTATNKLKMHMKQYSRRPQETMLKSFGLDPRQFKAMQRPTGARRTS